MTINADLHTHTIFSHGKGTPEQVVLAAIQKGLKKVAITDHAPSHIFYGIRNAERYISTIELLKERYAGKIEVLAGMEFNIVSLDGQFAMDERIMGKLDIILIGYHKAVFYRNLKSGAHFYLSRKKDKADLNTQSYIEAINKNRIDIIAHPGYGITLNHSALAQACAKRGVVVEINASHHELSLENLQAYMDAGVQFAISSDAHTIEKVGCFDNALAWARKAGINKSRIINAK